MQSFSTQFTYLYGQPKNTAVIRSKNEDFSVFEIPAFDTSGEGEHWYLKIRKNGENSDWVAKELARFFNVGSKEIGYAGKKDRHAITEQWFSVCLPGVTDIDLQGFETETIQVVDVTKHSRKLKTGALKGNHFSIVIRNIDNNEDFKNRLELIKEGVPNYFGEQRFGHSGNNIRRGIGLLKNEFREKNRTKKGLYISAVRSWFFNYVLSHRIEQGLWAKALPGDVVMLDGSHSHFLIDDLEEIQQRVDIKDLHLTGPMLGRGHFITDKEARHWEEEHLQAYTEILEQLAFLGLRQERRSLRLLPKNVQAQCLEQGVWKLSFSLPPGTFATSVLRELCDFKNAGAIA